MSANTEFIHRVLAIVKQIPVGQVATYGQIVRLAGRPQNARQVGHIMHAAPQYGKCPCHRVVTATGRLVPGWVDQRPMLLSEQVLFKDDSHVQLSKCQWRP